MTLIKKLCVCVCVRRRTLSSTYTHTHTKPQNVNIISINSWNGLPNGCMGNNLQHHSHKASNNNSTAEQHCNNNNKVLCFIYEHFPQEFFAVEFFFSFFSRILCLSIVRHPQWWYHISLSFFFMISWNDDLELN